MDSVQWAASQVLGMSSEKNYHCSAACIFDLAIDLINFQLSAFQFAIALRGKHFKLVSAKSEESTRKGQGYDLEPGRVLLSEVQVGDQSVTWLCTT